MIKSRKAILVTGFLAAIVFTGGMTSLTPQASAFFPTKKSTVSNAKVLKDFAAFNRAYSSYWAAAVRAIYPPYTGNWSTYSQTVKANYAAYLSAWKTINSQLPAVWSANSNASYFAAWDAIGATIATYTAGVGNASLTSALTNLQNAYATLKADFL